MNSCQEIGATVITLSWGCPNRYAIHFHIRLDISFRRFNHFRVESSFPDETKSLTSQLSMKLIPHQLLSIRIPLPQAGALALA